MKKPILIDEFTYHYSNNTREFKLNLHETKFKFSKIIKPIILNVSFINRLYHAYLIIIGKAHAFQYFQDLSPKQQKKYVMDDLHKQIRKNTNEEKNCLNCYCKENEKNN